MGRAALITERSDHNVDYSCTTDHIVCASGG